MSNRTVLHFHFRYQGDSLFTMSIYVAAIDFGTTYSGYAFSVNQPETELQDIDILFNQVWNSGTAGVASTKTPTCLLLSKDRQVTVFGYEAEEQYADIVMDGQAENFYFFHRFKMHLHNNKVNKKEGCIYTKTNYGPN